MVDGGGGQAFQPVGEGQTVNEWGTNKRMRAADGRPRSGWWTVVGEAFQPVGKGQTVNEWGNE
jgi:hypothetical protein